MRIGIIGYGYVGKAIAGSHDRNMIMINDPYALEEWEQYSIADIKANTGWIYVCVPTPVAENGTCDTSILKGVLDSLSDYEGTVICKSTAPPEFYIGIAKECGQWKKYKFKLAHMPEFLTAANALHDYMHPRLIVIGGTAPVVNHIAQFVIPTDLTYKTKARIVKTDIGSAAAMKYYANSWLATKVIFNNQFAKWCESQGVDWNEVATVCKEDLRLGDTHYRVPGDNGDVGYAGACFPKDISAILSLAEQKNVDMSLLKTQVDINNQMREQQRLEREEAERLKSSIPGRRRRDDLPRGPAVRPPRRRG
jgi:UDPglucose 6-dehydrogenase